LLWTRSPIRERHIQWQIWHSKLLVDGGPDLRRSHLYSNSWIRHTLNFSAADLHKERPSALSITSASNSEGAILQRFIVVFLVSFVLPTRTPGTMMELSIEDLLWNSCFIHTNYISTPTELCILQKCLCSTYIAYFQYSSVRYMFLPLDVSCFSETRQVKLI